LYRPSVRGWGGGNRYGRHPSTILASSSNGFQWGGGATGRATGPESNPKCLSDDPNTLGGLRGVIHVIQRRQFCVGDACANASHSNCRPYSWAFPSPPFPVVPTQEEGVGSVASNSFVREWAILSAVLPHRNGLRLVLARANHGSPMCVVCSLLPFLCLPSAFFRFGVLCLPYAIQPPSRVCLY